MPTIRDLSKARIVVVGDAMLDVWVHGRVERISPEAPVPVFVEERREERAGGAANVCVNVRALGAFSEFRGKAIELLPVKTRFVVNHQQIFRSDLEDCTPITQAEEDHIMHSVEADKAIDVLIISDYAKGVCTPSLCQRLIQWAKAHGVKVVADPKSDDWSKYDGAFILTPNLPEWVQGGRGNRRVSDHLLTTSGADGMLLTIGNHTGINIPATNTGPVDVTGAGDTVVAVLSAAIAVGFDLAQAARLANAAAGVVVGKFGTATCSLEELEAAYHPTYAEGVPFLFKPHKAPIVGFANGVFDCFHDGHRHFLRECKMNCTHLIVALNTDASALKLKEGVQDSEGMRHGNVLECLGPLDSIMFFGSERGLLSLITKYEPDVIFKGEDYHDKPVTGSDLARIHWIARHPGYSSTIERQKKLQPEPIAAEDI